jgi:AcrR family transcriptional regulator
MTVRQTESRRGAERRRAILDAALDLYARGGFRGTGLAAIGERVGVSHAAVLYHFGSAINLLRAVLEERDRRIAEHLTPIFAEGGLRALRRLPDVARVNVAHPGLARLHTVLQAENLDADSDVHDFFLARRRGVHGVLVNLLRSGQRRREIRRDIDVRHKADEIIAFMEGAQIQQLLDPARTDLVALYETYTEGFIGQIAARNGHDEAERGECS